MKHDRNSRHYHVHQYFKIVHYSKYFYEHQLTTEGNIVVVFSVEMDDGIKGQAIQIKLQVRCARFLNL